MSKSSAPESSRLTVFDHLGNQWVDLTLGATQPLGNPPADRNAIQQFVAPEWAAMLGRSISDEAAPDTTLESQAALSGFSFSRFVGSSDEANELAIWLARSSGARDGSRVLTVLGSQHGGTLALRSASGRPDWQAMDGPVCSGFRHIKPGSAAAIEKAIDETVAAVMISPIDWNRGGTPFDPQYLQEIQSICRQKSVAFIVDETRVAPGVSGQLGFWSQAKLEPDLLTLGTGWFFGLPGGVVLSRGDYADLINRIGPQTSSSQFTSINQALTSMGCFAPSSPVHQVAFLQTLATLTQVFTDDSPQIAIQQWQSQLAELKTGFDFVREISHQGWWTVLALDVPATELVATAARLNLRLRATGESTVLACPAVTCQPSEIDQTVKLLRQTLEMLETASTAETLS